MLARVARGAYLLALALMIAAYAMSAGTGDASTPKPEQPTEAWYC